MNDLILRFMAYQIELENERFQRDVDHCTFCTDTDLMRKLCDKHEPRGRKLEAVTLEFESFVKSQSQKET